MKTDRKKRRRKMLFGVPAFFLLVAAVVTVAMLSYGFISERSEDRVFIAVAMLCVVLFLSLVCTVADAVRRRVTVDRPVQNILDATDRISSGDFSVRLEPLHAYGKYDEFDCIMENLNKMTAELSAKEMLHSDFIAGVSHEMKTPLAVIQNYAEAIRAGADAETTQEYAEIIGSSARRLAGLVTDVLKLNKLENRELPPETERIRLDEMLAAAALRYEELIDEKGIVLNCDLDEVTVLSAPHELEIVWNNLLSNAVKFTSAGGRISLSVKAENGKAVVRVADTGCGIPPSAGGRIFEKFYQADASRSGEGNGLGLALVKKVIDFLGGEIFVESEVGKGSTFTVRLNASAEKGEA